MLKRVEQPAELVRLLRNHRAAILAFNDATIVAWIRQYGFCYGRFVASYNVREFICSSVAHHLREQRLRQGLTLNDVAKKAGLSRQAISFIEQEKRKPTLDTLIRITDTLGVEIEDIIRQSRTTAIKTK
jgi:DNA-binding XRE family transcriptional regulator